jgi:flagellar biosynthesis/type III secretory pathway protein FliH
MASPELAPRTPESGVEKPRDFEGAAEKIDHKNEKHETHEEAERGIEKAREEVNKEAISGREAGSSEHDAKSEPTPTPHRSRKESYEHTMKTVRNELSGPSRAFSKVIHNPVVERTSELVGSTVARPNAILSGSLFAALSVLGLYLMARHYGFSLQGSETIITFVIGWAIGVMFDLLRGMITGKR